MKIDSTSHWVFIARWTHNVMFEPFQSVEFIDGTELIEGDEQFKTLNHTQKLIKLSYKMHSDAWWSNCDEGWEPFEMYAMYYARHGLSEEVLKRQWRCASFEVNWKLDQLHEWYYLGKGDSPIMKTPLKSVVDGSWDKMKDNRYTAEEKAQGLKNWNELQEGFK